MKNYHNYVAEDFTIVLCAYKECDYLEESIKAIMSQTVKPHVLISTSTPNEHIYGLASKYGIDVRVNPDGGHVKDYNFALEQADTALCMLAHQDDILHEKFVESCLREINTAKKPIIAFTNYLEMHNDVIDKKPSGMVRIKRLMLFPCRSRFLRETRFGKWLIQCMGDPITHPTVVCVKKEMPDICFKEQYKASMDWDFWERLSKQKGAFVYVPDVLLYHRMNDENTTSILLETSNVRYEEEYEIFCRFWPKPIAKLIMKFYSKASKYY